MKMKKLILVQQKTWKLQKRKESGTIHNEWDDVVEQVLDVELMTNEQINLK
jgi:hypothetical protein